MQEEFINNNDYFINLILNELNNFPNIKEHFNNNGKIIEYGLFTKDISLYFKKIMEKYLSYLQLKNLDCIFTINSNLSDLGMFKSPSTIIINEKIIEDIYLKRKNKIQIIFHELFHFKLYSDVVAGIINKPIMDIIKDILLKDYCFDYYDSMKNKERLPKSAFDKYYSDNYENTMGEIYAELYSSYCNIIFFKSLNIEIDEKELKEIRSIIDDNTRKINGQLPLSFRNIINFNDNNLTLDEAFETAIHFNPEWVNQIEQLQIEYYINEEGKVCKRTIEELEQYRDITKDNDTKSYLNIIIEKQKVAQRKL